ncbi:MAG TPA: site-specific integrase, partial [Acidimicrobiia bacterium]|nr:site-specific integrase [Acidimicrobiia bacterium]
MPWKQTGHPTVQKQRERWVVRVPGIDTETGRRQPRQLGTFRSRRAAQSAATSFAASGDIASDRGTVARLVDRWVAGKIDVSNKTRQQYQWAAGHIKTGLGGIRADQVERDDIARWLEGLAAEGRLSRRSIQIIRMVLRAALDDAVAIGELRRNPAARVAMPRQVSKPAPERDTEVWTESQIQRFFETIRGHRWEGPLRLAVLYGLRRSELLGLRWAAVSLRKGAVRIERGVVDVAGRPEWSDGKNERSRRTIPIDDETAAALTSHRRLQAMERLAAGPQWEDNDLVLATRAGRVVSPRNFDTTFARLVAKADVPRLSSHGLRHTAATHMVRHASDIGEIRAAADILGHSPDMLMKTYAHVLPESARTVTEKIAKRGST